MCGRYVSTNAVSKTKHLVDNPDRVLDAENFKVIADDLVKSNNITPLLHTLVVDAIVDNNIIKGVIIENKAGRSAILAKRVIDCTGDADIAFHGRIHGLGWNCSFNYTCIPSNNLAFADR